MKKNRIFSYPMYVIGIERSDLALWQTAELVKRWSTSRTAEQVQLSTKSEISDLSRLITYLSECSYVNLRVRIPLKRDVLDTTLWDKDGQWHVAGQWFSLGPPVFSTNKSDRHDISEILLKVTLNTITLNPSFVNSYVLRNTFWCMCIFGVFNFGACILGAKINQNITTSKKSQFTVLLT